MRKRFPFERMSYKFSYGVQVRRSTLLNQRSLLEKHRRPNYFLRRGYRITPRHPDGGEVITAPIRRPWALPPSPLAHPLAQLIAQYPNRTRRDARRVLLGRLLLYHWRFLAVRHE